MTSRSTAAGQRSANTRGVDTADVPLQLPFVLRRETNADLYSEFRMRDDVVAHGAARHRWAFDNS